MVYDGGYETADSVRERVEQTAADQAAATAQAAAAVVQAKAQINEAVAGAVTQTAPQVIESAQSIIDSAKVCETSRNQILSSLAVIFPDINIEPWLSLGTEDYFIKRKQDLQTVRDNTYEFDTDAGASNASSGFWDHYARGEYKERMATNALRQDHILTHIWQSDGVSSGIGNGPSDATISRYKDSSKRWSWVSTLDETFSLKVPQVGAFDRINAQLALENLNIAAGTPASSGFGSESSSNFTYSEDGNKMYSKEWPHLWLTTLESAMAILGYYIQAADQTLLEGLVLRDAATGYAKPYSLFTAADIRHLQGDGDPEAGWNSIMDANHSNLDSWTSTNPSRLPYNIGEPLAGANVPRNYVKRSFQTAGMGCEGALWQPNDVWTSPQAGMSPAMEDFRPYSLLKHGGVLSQGIFNSPFTSTTINTLNGHSFATKGASNTQGRIYLSYLEKKLRADASRFRSLSDLNSEQTAALSAMNIVVHSQTSSQAQAASLAPLEAMSQEIKDADVFSKLGNLLDAVASICGGALENIRSEHEKILAAHRTVIIATCDAIGDTINAFTEDDGWMDLFNGDDDWDNNLGADVLSDLGNPFDQIGDTLIGTGATNIMFKEQCFLLSFISDLAISKKLNLDRGTPSEPASKRLPYYVSDSNIKSLDNNATILMDGGSYGFLNRLTQNPKLTRFYNALNHELSSLQPKIRLWKVIFDEEGNEQEIEIKFETHFSAADLDMFKNSDARGVGAGLKSFNFVYDGSNPFSVKKSIKANLKIFGNSMSEILRDRPSHYVDDQGVLQPTTYKYSDLAMKTWNTAEGSAEEFGEVSSTGCSPEFELLAENTAKAELNFRLKAEVGFSQPMNAMSSMHEDLRESLSESFVTLNLTPTVHNFDIDEMGRVVFNLNYLAYVEQFFDQSMFNVFSSPSIALNRIFRELSMKHYNTAGCNSEQISQQKEDHAVAVKAESQEAIASLLGDMMTEDLIYYINIPYSKITSFLSYGPHRTYAEFAGADSGIAIRSNAQHNDYLKERVATALTEAFGESATAGAPADEQNQIQAALLGNDPREADLSFFYLSDLIDLVLVKIETGISAVIENINELSSRPNGSIISCEAKMAKRKDFLNAQKNLKKLRIMLGPMELTHPQAKDGYTSVHVNLGDCPISVKYFIEWLTNKMLQKDEISYNLTKFVNDLINNLITNFLNNDQCFGYSIKQKTRLNQSAISSYGANQTYDPVTLELVTQASNVATESTTNDPSIEPEYTNFRAHLNSFPGMPVLNPSGPSNSARTSMPLSNEYNYFVYFAGRVMPEELMLGNKQSDEENFGIFHYMLGRDRGLVKNIKLTKTQTKGLAEVRFEQNGYDGLEQLRVTYDAQVDMFASVNTFPGTYIYIDPRGFAPEGSGRDNFKLTALGIGGYYMIVRSEHEFAEGKANTTLHTKWVNQVDGDEGERQTQIAASSTGTGDAQSRQCNIRLRPDPAEDPPESGGFLSLFGL